MTVISTKCFVSEHASIFIVIMASVAVADNEDDRTTYFPSQDIFTLTVTIPEMITDVVKSSEKCLTPLAYEKVMKIAPVVFLIIGTVFNLLSFSVLQRPNLRGVVTTLFYRIFVLCDVVILNIIAWAVLVRYHFGVSCCDNVYCHVIQYSINVFMDVNAWNICIVHFNAHGLVTYPHKAMTEWTIKRALACIAVTFLIALLVDIPILVFPEILIPWAATKIFWSNGLALVIPMVFNVLINLTLRRTFHQESIGCCKLTSLAVIIMSLYIINTCMTLPFNIYQLYTAIAGSGDVILLPGYVSNLDWKVMVAYFTLLTGCTVKFAVFRSFCPRFSGECNKALCMKETTMKPIGYVDSKKSNRQSHIHMDSPSFAKKTVKKKISSEKESTQSRISMINIKLQNNI